MRVANPNKRSPHGGQHTSDNLSRRSAIGAEADEN
jgi:hypothetical protein